MPKFPRCSVNDSLDEEDQRDLHEHNGDHLDDLRPRRPFFPPPRQHTLLRVDNIADCEICVAHDSSTS